MVTAPAIGYWYGFTGTCCCVCVGATSSGVNVAVSQHPMPGYGTPATHPMIGLHCTPLSISTGQLAGGFDKSVFKLCDNEALHPRGKRLPRFADRWPPLTRRSRTRQPAPRCSLVAALPTRSCSPTAGWPFPSRLSWGLLLQPPRQPVRRKNWLLYLLFRGLNFLVICLLFYFFLLRRFFFNRRFLFLRDLLDFLERVRPRVDVHGSE